MKLLNCRRVGCHCCKEAIRVGKNLFREDLYICKHVPKKHKSIDGMDCRKFKCKKRGVFPVPCSSCRG